MVSPGPGRRRCRRRRPPCLPRPLAPPRPLTVAAAAPSPSHASAVRSPFALRPAPGRPVPTPRTVVVSLRLRPMRIMPMGDSITDQGTMPGYRGYLLQRLQQAGKHVDYVGSRRQAGYPLTDADHEGHPGLRNDELAALAGATVRTHQPDLVLLMAGANDLEQGHGPTVATDRMVGLLRTIYADRPSVRVVVTTLIPDAAAPAEDVVATTQPCRRSSRASGPAAGRSA